MARIHAAFRPSRLTAAACSRLTGIRGYNIIGTQVVLVNPEPTGHGQGWWHSAGDTPQRETSINPLRSGDGTSGRVGRSSGKRTTTPCPAGNGRCRWAKLGRPPGGGTHAAPAFR